MTQAKAKKFMTVEAVGGRAAINVDLVGTVSFASLMVPGLLAGPEEYLRLYLPGSYIDIADVEEQQRVLGALGVKDLAAELEEVGG
jgi:hypothetical protein